MRVLHSRFSTVVLVHSVERAERNGEKEKDMINESLNHANVAHKPLSDKSD